MPRRGIFSYLKNLGKTESQKSESRKTPDAPMMDNWEPAEETAIMVGLPAVVSIVPWLPPSAYLELSKTVQLKIEKLETTRHNRADPLFADINLDPNRSLTETLEEAQQIVEQFRRKQWVVKVKGQNVPFGQIISRTASNISQYMQIVGPIAEATPFGAPIVWGAFNMLLKMAMDDADMAEKLTDFIDSYTSASGIYATYGALYRHSQARSGEKVKEILGRLEQDVRRFTSAARKLYFQKNAAARIFKTAASPFAAEFQPICDAIRDRTQTLQIAVSAAVQDETKRDQVLTWLSKIHYRDAHENAVKKRVPDTCNWLRKKDAYIRWKASSTSSILWVHGKAGFGKTILMSSVVDTLREILPRGEIRQKHVAYFYCNHDKPETLDAANILASILKQIVGSLPDIPDKIIYKFDQQQRLGQPSSRHALSELRELLSDALNFVPQNAPIFIVIDGVDECEFEARAELLGTLTSLAAEKPRPTGGGVKLAVFSRNKEDIREELGSCEEIPIQKSDNMEDMVTFMNLRIASSKPLQQVLQKQQNLRSKMVDELVNNSGGMFLWVNLQQKTICQERDALSITLYLRDLPNSSDMEESYQRIVEQIVQDSPGNRRLAETVLGWVLCAVRPLSVAELTDALGFLNLSGKGKEKLKSDILYSCHGMIDTEKQGDTEYFRFVHFSARQFLQDFLSGFQDTRNFPSFGKRGSVPFNSYPSPPQSPKLGAPLSPVRTASLNIDNWEVQKQMVKTCLDYLCQRALKKALLPGDAVYQCRQELETLVAEQPFVLYAAQAWVEHYRKVPNDPEINKELFELFTYRENSELAFQLFWFQKFQERFPRGSTPLHIASYLGLPDLISALLARGPDEEYFCYDEGMRTPLYWAAFQGNVSTLAQFGISTGNKITLEDSGLQQLMGEALLAAIEGDQTSLVHNLLACGANPNLHVREGKGALFLATTKGDSNLPLVKRLIEAGALIEPPAPNLAPMEAAAMSGSFEIAKYFLTECKADVNANSNEQSGLPIKFAVFSGHHEIVKLLLNSGANLELAVEDELIQWASLMGDQEMIAILLQHAPSHTSHGAGCPANHRHISSTFSQLSVASPQGNEGLNAKDKAKDVSAKCKALQTGIRQAIRFAKFHNPSAETLNAFVGKAQRVLENKFTNLDFAFLEAAETVMPKLVKESLDATTASIIESGCHCFGRALIHMEQNSKSLAQVRFTEWAMKIIASLVVHLLDNGFEGHLRTSRIAIEIQLLQAIDKRQVPETNLILAEVEMGMQLGTLMISHPLWLRGCVKTYLAGITAMSPGEGVARFKRSLEGVTVLGLNIHAGPGVDWRRMIVFIEIGYCAFAYGHSNLFPHIQLKIGELRKDLRDNRDIQAHEAVLDHFVKISEGGSAVWEWDSNEDPWWQKLVYIPL